VSRELPQYDMHVARFVVKSEHKDSLYDNKGMNWRHLYTKKDVENMNKSELADKVMEEL